MRHDPKDAEYLIERLGLGEEVDGQGGSNDEMFGTLADSQVSNREKERAKALRDQIAKDMWESYQAYLLEHGHEMDMDVD
ncbi:hypothetical protein B0H34DRAFT_822151, partial [Crassisporium funariophilum]